jgi:hypothetical protein
MLPKIMYPVAHNQPYCCLKPCIQLPNPHEKEHYKTIFWPFNVYVHEDLDNSRGAYGISSHRDTFQLGLCHRGAYGISSPRDMIPWCDRKYLVNDCRGGGGGVGHGDITKTRKCFRGLSFSVNLSKNEHVYVLYPFF